MGKRYSKSIVWFKNDLRLHDNLVLQSAAEFSEHILPVYIIDEKLFSHTQYGFPKINKYRLHFLKESLLDLQQQMQAMGIDLPIYVGKPEQILTELVLKNKIDCVFTQKEYAHDELQLKQKLRKLLQLFNCSYEPIDNRLALRYPSYFESPEQLPDRFTDFLNSTNLDHINYSQTLHDCQFIETLNKPEGLAVLEEFIQKQYATDRFVQIPLVGGETAGLSKIAELFSSGKIDLYKQTTLKTDEETGTMISAYLAFGCISAAKLLEQLKQYGPKNTSSSGAEKLINDLLLRDYVYLRFLKFKENYFKRSWPNLKLCCRKDYDLLEEWINAKTSSDYVNAIMKQIAQSGWANYENRKIAAHYLSKNLKVDWRMGAAYYESMLVDYDVCMNYANWAKIAGVVHNRYNESPLDMQSVTLEHDANGAYRKQWLNAY